jgi:anthranilate synthase/aminodeoxychorismate synthase-like glutamine amidotransferase
MIPRVLLIDNFDSFTHNLVQALRELGAVVQVVRPGTTGASEALAWDPTHVMLSPGPGRPEDAHLTLAVLEAALGRWPILGVCLGHQALIHLLGGRVGRARQLVHGKASPIHHDGRTVFAGLPSPFPAGRYHSLAAHNLPESLEVSATTEDGEIMAVRHRTLAAHGVQFHPESILTPEGPRLLANFLTQVRVT